MESLLSKARKIAEAAHAGQRDKAGEAYIKHPLAVSQMLATEEEKIVALLHDVVEDTQVTIEDLAQEFPEKITEAISLLTKIPGQDYHEYLSKIKVNPLARAVKIADMQHNSRLSRIPQPSDEDILRVEKYTSGIAFLTGREKTK